MNKDLFLYARQSFERGWAVLALELHIVQKEEQWKPEYTSFSDYVTHVARALKLSSRLVWRYRKAYAIFIEIAPRYVPVTPHDTPEDISRCFSPDALELLDQFRQVMPAEHFDNYCRDFFAGKLKREDLRADWKNFRKAIDGKIPRRRETRTSRAIPAVNSAMQQKAVALKLTRECVQNRLNTPLPVHRLIFMTAVQWSTLPLPELDAICIVQQQPGSPPEVHGISLISGSEEEVGNHIQLAESCDYFWLAATSPVAPEKVGESIGLLYVNKSSAVCIQQATRLSSPDTEPANVAIMRFLLTKCQP